MAEAGTLIFMLLVPTIKGAQSCADCHVLIVGLPSFWTCKAEVPSLTRMQSQTGAAWVQVVPCLAMFDTMKYIGSDVGTVGFGGCMGMSGFLLAVGKKVCAAATLSTSSFPLILLMSVTGQLLGRLPLMYFRSCYVIVVPVANFGPDMR